MRATVWIMVSGLILQVGGAMAQTDCAPIRVDVPVQSLVQQSVAARAAEKAGNTAVVAAVQVNTGKSVGVDADLPVQTAAR